MIRSELTVKALNPQNRSIGRLTFDYQHTVLKIQLRTVFSPGYGKRNIASVQAPVLGKRNLPYSGKFSRSNTSSRKFVPAKKFFSKNFLLTSRAQFLRAADPVNWQKIYLFVVEASSKLRKRFATYDQLACRHRNCEQILVLAPPFGMAVFRRQRPTRFDSVVTSYYRFGV